MAFYFFIEWDSKRFKVKKETFVKKRIDSTAVKTVVESPILKPKHVVFTVVEKPVNTKHLELRKWYHAQTGVREVGGNNKGKEVEYYLKRAAGLKSGYAWCAAYVVTGFLDNEIKCSKTAMAKDVALYNVVYKIGKHQTFPDTSINHTLAFGLYYSSLGRIGHTGYVDLVKSGALITSEGNTNADKSREGDEVGILIRPKGTIYCISKYL